MRRESRFRSARFGLTVALALIAGEAAHASRVHLRGGTILQGDVESQDALGILLRTRAGERLFLSASDVERIEDEAPASTPSFMRFVEHGRKGATLETLDATYLDLEAGVKVTLVSAIHIADRAFFEKQQAVLESHDRILYEGVGRGGTGSAADSDLEFVNALQREMNDLLGLTFQHDGIRYGGPKWRNADLSWDEIKKDLEEKHLELIPNFALAKTLAPLAMKLIGFEKSLIEKSGEPDAFRNRLKRMVGGLLARSDELLRLLSANKEKWRDDVLVGSRNAAAIAILKDELEKKTGRSFAIFYGAAHMKDMERRLVEDLHLVKVAESWVVAWDVP
jgi:hypothetical protein